MCAQKEGLANISDRREAIIQDFEYVKVTQKTHKRSCRACGEQGHRSNPKKCKERKASVEVQSDVWVKFRKKKVVLS